MRVLGIDTATRLASVALLAGGDVVAEEAAESPGHGATLMPLVERVLARAGCPAGSLDAVAVSAGPGGFTGLRVGLSVAKGIAWATGARVVPVPTLEALAHAAPPAATPVWPVLDARKGEVYAACLQRTGNGWETRLPPSLLTVERLAGMVAPPCVLLGNAVVRYGAWLRERLGPAVTILPWPAFAPRGAVVARLGAARLEEGTATAGPALEPLYVRPPDAVAGRP